MRKFELVSVWLVMTILCTSAAHAQACLGLPSFGRASVHVNLAGDFPDSASALAVGIGGGRDNHVFGNLGAGQITYEGLDEKSTFGFLELGHQITIARAHICPIASGYIGSGPDDVELGLTAKTRGAAAGIAVGTRVTTHWASLVLMPNTAVRYGIDQQEIEEEGIGSNTDTFEGGVVDVGLGIVFRDRVSIQPILHIPFGENDNSSFGIFAAFRFNWRDF